MLVMENKKKKGNPCPHPSLYHLKEVTEGDTSHAHIENSEP